MEPLGIEAEQADSRHQRHAEEDQQAAPDPEPCLSHA
jgi:hypothetical protein